ncbi:unnamed protein product, partial [Pylaiella littoralis]
NNWYQRFRKRHRFSIRRRTSVGQKLPKGHEGMASVDGKDLTSGQLESVAEEVFEELGNMNQTPVQHEMPAETTLQQRGDKDARIATGGKEKERFTLCLAVTADGKKIPVRIILKGTPFIPTVTGVGRATQPRKNSIAAEILPQNRRKFGHPMGGMFFGLWIKESWRVRPNNGSVLKQRACILVLDDFKCHKDDEFIAFLKRDTNTIVIFIPGRLTPLLQPLDRMLNKQMKRLLRGMYTKHSASAARDPKTGKLTPPGRGAVSTWCKDAWATITPEMVKTCFKICGLSLALDGSEDHAWCT